MSKQCILTVDRNIDVISRLSLNRELKSLFVKKLNSFKISNFWGAMSRSSFRDGLRSGVLTTTVPRDLPWPIRMLAFGVTP